MNPILQAKAHDNVLELRCEAATNMKFDASVGDYCITTDQPYNGTTCEYDGDGYTLRITSVQAVRHLPTWPNGSVAK